MKYTYYTSHLARTVTGQKVMVPDQVAENQDYYDQRSFPAIALHRSGQKIRATLRGDLYGLHTAGTGDMIVSL